MHALTAIIEQRKGIAIRILIAQVLFLALCWFGTVDYAGRYAGADLAQYRAMAQAAPSLHHDIPAPFAYRVAVPWLVGMTFPGDDVSGFAVFHLLLVLALAIQFFRLLKLYGASEPLALVLVSVALWNPYFGGFLLYNPFQAGDALAYLLMLVALEGTKRHSPLLFGSALLVAALVRETPFLLIPAVMLAHGTDRRNVIALSLSSLPAVAVFILARHTITVSNPEWSLVSTLSAYAPELFSPERWGRLLINTCAPLSFLMMALVWRERRTSRFLSVEGLLGAGIVAACFLGGDVERLASPLLLLVLLSFHHHLDECLQDANFRYALLAGVVFCSLHFLFAAYPLIPKVPYYAGALLFSGCVLWTGVRALQRVRPAEV